MKLRIVTWIVSLAVVGCGGGVRDDGALTDRASGGQPVSWEEFKRSARQVIDGRTIYVVEWDMRVSEEGLRPYYNEYLASFGKVRGELGEVAQKSVVDRSFGVDNVFHGQQMNLRYCVSNDFGADKTRAVDEMGWATSTWEWLARVNFTYVASEDANCNNDNPNVVIALRPVGGNSPPCGAFPTAVGGSNECPARTLHMNFALIASSTWTNSWPNLTSVGAFRHELGHMLGLRHEMAQSTDGLCSLGQGSAWRSLTGYDNTSVMHYPGMCGAPNTDQNISVHDVTGMRRLYGEVSDKLLWHKSTGESQLWYMTSNGTTRLSYEDFPSSLHIADSTGWKPIGLADFNKDGKMDIVWHHTDGPTSIWYMDGINYLGFGWLDGWFSLPDSAGWRMVAFADFNKDGNTDILLHHSGGANGVWYMDGATVSSTATLSTSLNFADSSGWRLDAVKDFNHDGNPDWLMHNGNTGQMYISYMDGITTIDLGFFSTSLNVPDSSGWRLFGSHDFNRDGSPDLIWHHVDGAHGLWYLEGTSVLGFGELNPSLNIPNYLGWSMVPR